MNYKKFCIIFLTLIIIIFSFIVTVNYYFDFYAVFNQNKDYYVTVNDRYAKVEYILGNKEKYNTFIWGSSRVQKMDPLILGKEAYNMGAVAGLPDDCLRDLKIFLNNGVNIKTIYLGIDSFSYKNDYKYEIQGINRNPYTENYIDRIRYLIEVAFKIPDFKCIKERLNSDTDKLGKNYLTTTGKFLVPEYVEKGINKSIEEYVYDKKFEKPHIDEDREHIDYTISVIKEIKTICDVNDINFKVFFNPVHITTYLNDDIKLSNRFKRELVKITDFYDFNYINFVTINNYFWYETSHPRYFVCDWELKVITNQYDKNIPEDFGHLITKENIDYYCNKYIIDREYFKKPSKQYIPKEPII